MKKYSTIRAKTLGGLLTSALGRGPVLVGAEEFGDPRDAGGRVARDEVD